MRFPGRWPSEAQRRNSPVASIFVILGVLSGGVAGIAFATMSEFGLLTPVGCLILLSCFSPAFCRRHFLSSSPAMFFLMTCVISLRSSAGSRRVFRMLHSAKDYLAAVLIVVSTLGLAPSLSALRSNKFDSWSTAQELGPPSPIRFPCHSMMIELC